MVYISTADYGQLSENPLRGSTARYVAHPIVDDIDNVDPDAPADEIHPKIEYVPPSCKIVGDPSTNDLATKRWGMDSAVSAETEADLIRRVKNNDPHCKAGKPQGCGCPRCQAFNRLLAAHHRTVLKPAGKFIPKGTAQPRPNKSKHTNNLLFEDLTSVGCSALWRSALRFDPETGNRFNTLARHKIAGAISDEAIYQRSRGYTSGDTVRRYLKDKVSAQSVTRLDRWIFSHLGSPPEALLEAQATLVKKPVYHSLEEAEAALKAAAALEHPDIYCDTGDDCDLSRKSKAMITASPRSR